MSGQKQTLYFPLAGSNNALCQRSHFYYHPPLSLVIHLSQSSIMFFVLTLTQVAFYLILPKPTLESCFPGTTSTDNVFPTS